MNTQSTTSRRKLSARANKMANQLLKALLFDNPRLRFYRCQTNREAVDALASEGLVKVTKKGRVKLSKKAVRNG